MEEAAWCRSQRLRLGNSRSSQINSWGSSSFRDKHYGVLVLHELGIEVYGNTVSEGVVSGGLTGWVEEIDRKNIETVLCPSNGVEDDGGSWRLHGCNWQESE